MALGRRDKGIEQNEQGEAREVGVSTEPGGSYMDEVQEQVQETGKGPEGENMALTGWQGENSEGIEVDRDAADVLEPTEEPKQVKPAEVIFVPFEDFEARINQQEFKFRKDVPARISREDANMYLESKKGYVK